MLSRFLYCAWATAAMAPISLFLFPCYELSLGSNGTILLWSFFRALFFFVSSYSVSKLLARDKDRKDDEIGLQLILAMSVKRCLIFMTISGCGVAACLGVQDFISTLIASDWIGMNTTQQDVAWFVWAAAITLFAAVRQNKKLPEENDLEEDHATR